MAVDDPAALLVVDVQRDFCAGGTLAVPDGDRIVPVINGYLEQAERAGLPVYASRDWHPAETTHFKQAGGRWPAHCVQGTLGAEFHAELRLPSGTVVISKGTDPAADGYSAFEGLSTDGRRLLDDLRQRGIDHLYVVGLATDFCVKQSVLDALAAGLRVTVLEDAIAGSDTRETAEAMTHMRKRGAVVRSNARLNGHAA